MINFLRRLFRRRTFTLKLSRIPELPGQIIFVTDAAMSAEDIQRFREEWEAMYHGFPKQDGGAQ